MRAISSMKQIVSLAVLAGTASLGSWATSAAEAATLVRNDFYTANDGTGVLGATNSDGSLVVPVPTANNIKNETQPWAAPSGLEGKGLGAGGSLSGGGGNAQTEALGLAGKYDHDNNGGTADVAVPGFVEVNGWDNNNPDKQFIITTAFPASGFDASGNLVLTFWAAARTSTGGTGQATSGVKITNATDGVDILAQTVPTFAATPGNWQFNSFSISQNASWAGDTLVVTFFGGGVDGASGLELTDLTLQSADAVAVPEPASIGLLGLGAMVMVRRRRTA